MTMMILATLLLAFAPFLCLWAVSIKVKDASIIDIFWGPSFACTSIIAIIFVYSVLGSAEPIAWLVAGLTTLWGARLGLYLFKRNVGHGEDWRYQKMRAARPDTFNQWTLYGVFGLQWLIMSIVSLPVVATIVAGGPINAVTYIGIAVYLIGFLFEAIGDAQLSAFKADPANSGTVMNKGLWAWTRHPNYFGNATLWWGLGLIAAGAGHWWTLVGPAVMTYFLINVSGKAMLERKLRKSRAGYEDYVAKTSGFFPLPPKK